MAKPRKPARQPVLSMAGVSVGYGATAVVSGAELELRRGAAIALVGPNGAGKSTVLRACAGALEPLAGTITLLGGSPQRTDPELRRDVSILLDEPTWYPDLTVVEHLELVGLAHGLAEPQTSLLQDLGLGEHLAYLPDNLSSGQRQRLRLACVLARPSKVLLLDEPEQRLDPDTRVLLGGLLRQRCAQGAAVLMASHDASIVHALGAAAVLVDDGRLDDGDGEQELAAEAQIPGAQDEHGDRDEPDRTKKSRRRS